MKFEGIEEKLFTSFYGLIAVFNKEGLFSKVNENWVMTFGWKQSEIIGKSYKEFIHPDDIEAVLRVTQAVPYRNELHMINRYRHKDGTYLWIEWHTALRFNDGSSYCMAQDITKSYQNDVRLKLAKRAARLGIWERFVNQNEIHADDVYCEIYALPKETGITFDEWLTRIHPDDRYKVLKTITEAGRIGKGNHEFRIQSKSGEISYIKASYIVELGPNGTPAYMTGIDQDITAEVLKNKELELQRARAVNSSKMATLGELAAGIAHEVNNPLSVIMGRAVQLREYVEKNTIDSETFKKGLDQIQNTSQRIAKIVKGLKMLSRNSEKDAFIKTSLKSVFEETLDLCHVKLQSKGIYIQINGLESDIYISCKSALISQVLLNLIDNSVDAIEMLQQKWIRLDVFKNTENTKVIIKIIDSGNGINSEIQELIWQPFFTTKSINKGTGLGLPLTKSIIEEHKGTFEYMPSCENTTFKIQIPLIK